MINKLVEERLTPYLEEIHSYMWDECHKIYINMTEDATKNGERIGYEVNLVTDEDRDKVIEVLSEWWEESCGLRFIYGITTDGNYSSDNDGFFRVIGQGEGYEEDDDYEDGESYD